MPCWRGCCGVAATCRVSSSRGIQRIAPSGHKQGRSMDLDDIFEAVGNDGEFDDIFSLVREGPLLGSVGAA
eukprot:2413170-Alexandrium_andersonii.AAC.1